ncbi:MAG: hypothetical protein AAF602_09765 [Myxococcota bacterium]
MLLWTLVAAASPPPVLDVHLRGLLGLGVRGEPVIVHPPRSPGPSWDGTDPRRARASAMESLCSMFLDLGVDRWSCHYVGAAAARRRALLALQHGHPEAALAWLQAAESEAPTPEGNVLTAVLAAWRANARDDPTTAADRLEAAVAALKGTDDPLLPGIVARALAREAAKRHLHFLHDDERNKAHWAAAAYARALELGLDEPRRSHARAALTALQSDLLDSPAGR